MMTVRNRWIAARLRPEPDLRSRLICFPHAGGGASLFNMWRDRLGERLELCPVILPGRDGRMGETRFRRLEDLIDPLMEALTPLFNLPYAIFGHSLGSVVAFEVARKAALLGLPPRLLIVSGRRAPHLRARDATRHLLDDVSLLESVRRLGGTSEAVLDDADLMKLFLPILRDDFALNETYMPLPGRPLTCDLVGIVGNRDPEVSETELLAWREVTSGAFSHRVLDGGHFFMQPDPEPLLDIIRACVAGLPR